MPNKKKQKKKVVSKKTKATPPRWSVSSLVLRLSASVVLIVVGFLTYFTLTNVSLAPTSIGTLPIDSTMSPGALEKYIASSTADYRLTLSYPDKSQKSFGLNETGMAIDAKQSASTITYYLHQHLWQRLAWWQPIKLKLVLSTDSRKLDEFIAAKATVVTVAPQDATLSAPDGTPTITSEKAGAGYQVGQVKDTLAHHASRLNADPLALKASALKPAINASNLTASKKKLEEILSQKVTFTLAGETISPSRATISDWIELSPVKTAKTVDVSIDSGKIVAYIDKIAEPYVYLPRNQIIMTMPTGPLTLDYGANGTDVSNKNEVATQVAKQLVKAKATSADLAIKYAEAKTVEVAPYDKFIIVDTSAKQLYAYEKTELVRTVPISAGAPKTPTVVGQFKIYSKRVSQDMTGGNADGSRYFQAAVPYVNYFYGSYAIHGNYWRPDSWFGNINSSHGCVGINDPDDAWIYNWAPVGTPVIVHN